MNDPLFPLALDLHGRRCLVVGESAEAAGRCRMFLEHGAQVVLVANEPGAELTTLLTDAQTQIEWRQRAFLPEDLEAIWLVVLADPDGDLAARLAAECNKRRLFFCAVDQPEHNSFSHVAYARVGPMTVTASTGGTLPGFARHLRLELERELQSEGVQAFLTRLTEARRGLPKHERREALSRMLQALAVRFELSGSSDEPEATRSEENPTKDPEPGKSP